MSGDDLRSGVRKQIRRTALEQHLGRRMDRRRHVSGDSWAELNGLLYDVLIFRVPATRTWLPVVLFATQPSPSPMFLGLRPSEGEAGLALGMFCDGLAELRKATMAAYPSLSDAQEPLATEFVRAELIEAIGDVIRDEVLLSLLGSDRTDDEVWDLLEQFPRPE